MAMSFDTAHADMVHDAQLDYYGKRLATCSSDRAIKIFDVLGDTHQHVADLVGHQGPVWQVRRIHPTHLFFPPSPPPPPIATCPRPDHGVPAGLKIPYDEQRWHASRRCAEARTLPLFDSPSRPLEPLQRFI
jgi:hypothetical protein